MVVQVEKLYRITSLDDIAENLMLAENMFAEAMKETKKKYCT